MNNNVFSFTQLDKEITDDEILEISRKQNKTVHEVKADLAHALKDLEYTTKEINNIISRNNYKAFPDNRIRIGEYGSNGEFNDKYMCHDCGEYVSQFSTDDMALVTGFGPTNSPTAGTLSIIFRLLDIQKKTNIYSHVIISDLGALNSRKKPLHDLLRNTEQFIRFISDLGFDYNCGEIRTHNHFDHSRVFTIASSVLSLEDFDDNKEATEDMYKRLKIQGNDFSTMVDQTFTVADILLPGIRDNKKLVLVSAGLEEHYYPRLTRIVIDRIKSGKGGINELINDEPKISAIYGKLINGLFPFVKMSKSIPDSAINIGDTESNIREKILYCGSRNEVVILQMMELASDWDIEKIKKARVLFENREELKNEWIELKKEYLEFFISIKRLWDKSAPTKTYIIKNRIFTK